jgi:arabinofuranan 3-O-arabinosyltransferase
MLRISSVEAKRWRAVHGRVLAKAASAHVARALANDRACVWMGPAGLQRRTRHCSERQSSEFFGIVLPMTRFNHDRARAAPLFVWGGVIVVAITLAALAASWIPAPLPRFLTNADFSNYWMAARLTLAGKTLDLFSGQEIYFAHLKEAFGPDYDWHNWSYPPHYLLLIAPLGWLGYLPAATVFLAVTLVMFVHAASIACRVLDRLGWIFIAAFAIVNVMSIQNGFLTASLVLYGLGLRERRPVLSGIAIGLLTIKPQLGILLPVLLLYEGRFRAIAAAFCAIAVLVAVSIAAFGLEDWLGYVARNLPYQNDVMMRFTGTFVAMMPSTLAALRLLSVDVSIASMIQLAVSMAAFGAYLWSLFALKSGQARAASTVIATFLISPYALHYDLGAVAVYAAAAYGLARQAEGASFAMIRLCLMVLALLPVCVLPLGAAGAPLAPLILALGWAGLIRLHARAPAFGEIGLSSA